MGHAGQGGMAEGTYGTRLGGTVGLTRRGFDSHRASLADELYESYIGVAYISLNCFKFVSRAVGSTRVTAWRAVELHPDGPLLPDI